MRLNHLDLQTPDVPALAQWFVTHFELVAQTRLDSPAIAILTDDGGFTLVLQRHDPVVYPEGFHLGFYVTTVDAVHARHARLVAAGVAPGPVETNNRGTMFYVRGPNALLVEVNCRKPRPQ